MEFPNLGKNCSETSCRRLDFLPVNCDACKHTFCSDHFIYDKHSCTAVRPTKDVQVPICPLCGQPVPTSPNTSPDITVSHHIDQNCSSTKSKIFTNKCNFGTCKKRELIPFMCSVCKKNFCLPHRHTTDHKCQGLKRNTTSLMQVTSEESNSSKHQTSIRNIFSPSSISSSNTRSTSRTAAANIPSRQLVQQVQGTMSEDEALAHALALSMQEEEVQQSSTSNPNQPSTVRVGGSNSKDKCALS